MITVKDIQQNVLPSFSEVVAGEDGLSREVSWVVVSRSRPPAFEALKGGEIALISLRSLRLLDEELDLARLFNYLDEMGVAAAAVLGNVSPEALSVADDLSLPVLTLPEGTNLNELNSLISRYIAENRQQLQQWNQEVYRQFTELAIEGKGIAAIAEHLCQLTGKAVIVEDANFRIRTRCTPALSELVNGRVVRSGAGTRYDRFENRTTGILSGATTAANGRSQSLNGIKPQPQAPESVSLEEGAEHTAESEVLSSSLREHVTALRDWLHNKELRPSDPPLHVFEGANGIHQLVAPIIVQAEVSGYVSLLGRDFTVPHRVALGRAAAALAIERAREIAVSAVEDRLQANVIDELLDGNFTNSDSVIERAKRLGYNLNLPYSVVAFSFRPEENRIRKRPITIVLDGQALELDSPISETMARELQRLVEQEANRRQITTITRVRDDRFVLLFSIGKEFVNSLEVKRTAKIFLDRFATHFSDMSVTGGIGRYYKDVEGISAMAAEAEKAVMMGLRLFGTGQLTFFGDLGVYRLLLTLGNTKELREFYTEVLGPLLKHDDKNNGELLQTLEWYFKCHGSPTDMAKAMSLHRNTLLYRLRRIEEILGVQLDDKDTGAETGLALHLALRIGEVLGERR
jgi:sugar diacid utilization regulator